MAEVTGLKSDEAISKPVRLVIVLPASVYFTSGVRDFALGLIGNTTSASKQWAYRFQSVVDELCNNAIEYGSSPTSDIRITFTVEGDKFFQVDVEDTGAGKDGMGAGQLKALVAERKQPEYIVKGIRGRGLSKIVAGWTDELLFEDRPEGGMKVTVKKYFKDMENKGLHSNKLPGTIAIHTA